MDHVVKTCHQPSFVLRIAQAIFSDRSNELEEFDVVEASVVKGKCILREVLNTKEFFHR